MVGSAPAALLTPMPLNKSVGDQMGGGPLIMLCCCPIHLFSDSSDNDASFRTLDEMIL